VSTFARQCRACGKELPPKHLRVQAAPPDEKWHEIRVHDLSCLIDFLEHEEDELGDGRDGTLFKVAHLPSEGPTHP
jgi:hypothetical protein